MLCRLKLSNLKVNRYQVRRNIWEWINKVFNSVDEDRRKLYGPDRTCAEWLLRNGGSVKWTGSNEYFSDYNSLPPENVKLFIKEVDATNSSISHYGFPHFVGCEHIDKIILHKCSYLENSALPLLEPINKTLKFLQVTSCRNITEDGLNSLNLLKNLETLIVADFPYLKDKDSVLKNLSQQLPKCKITFK